MTNLTTYVDSAIAMRTEASAEELTLLSELWVKFSDVSKQTRDGIIEMANKGRELGIHLQILCGHEQITLGFWNNNCVGKLPFDFEAAKMCISIAKKMPAPARTIEEAVQFVQLSLVADGVLTLPERAEMHGKAQCSMFQRFFNEMALMRQPWQKIIRETPMEKWESDTLRRFLNETEWLAAERDKAVKLRTKKETSV